MDDLIKLVLLINTSSIIYIAYSFYKLSIIFDDKVVKMVDNISSSIDKLGYIKQIIEAVM